MNERARNAAEEEGMGGGGQTQENEDLNIAGAKNRNKSDKSIYLVSSCHGCHGRKSSQAEFIGVA